MESYIIHRTSKMAEPGFKPVPSESRAWVLFLVSLRNGIFVFVGVMSGLLESKGRISDPVPRTLPSSIVEFQGQAPSALMKSQGL